MLKTARKGFAILSASKPKSSALPHRPSRQLGGRYACPCYARRYIPAAISSKLLFVKTCADYIITKLTESTHVNFSQSEQFVCMSCNLCLVRLFSFLCLLVLCHLRIHHHETYVLKATNLNHVSKGGGFPNNTRLVNIKFRSLTKQKLHLQQTKCCDWLKFTCILPVNFEIIYNTVIKKWTIRLWKRNGTAEYQKI